MSNDAHPYAHPKENEIFRSHINLPDSSRQTTTSSVATKLFSQYSDIIVRHDKNVVRQWADPPQYDITYWEHT
jgi:hypothetical protein